MVLQKFWVSQNFSRISWVSQSRFLAVMCVSQSRFFIRSSLGVSTRFFARLTVSKSRFVCLFFKIAFSRHLILNFIKGTFNFRRKNVILTSPKLSEFHKKLENLPQRHLAPEKKETVTLF